MMSTLSHWIAGLLVASSSLLVAEELPSLQDKAFRLMQSWHRMSSQEMEAILGPKRAQVLEVLRGVARGEVTKFDLTDRSQPQLDYTPARRVLLRVADPEVVETIGQQLAKYQYLSRYGSLVNGETFWDAVESRQPKLIPFFAKAMLRTEDAETRDFELAGPKMINRSVDALFWLLRLTDRIKEFPPEVAEWSRTVQMAHPLSNNEKREIGRAWWKANESAIVAGNYAAVRPGTYPRPGPPEAVLSGLPNPDDAKRVGPVQKPGSETSGINPASNPGTGDIAALPASRSGTWLLWATGAATILVAIGAIALGHARRRRRR